MANKAVVSGSPAVRVRVGTTVLSSVSEIVTCEVTLSGTPGETVRAGRAELVSVPESVATVSVDSDSLGETLGVVLDIVGLVSVGWVTNKTVVCGSPEESVRVGTADLTSVP